MNLLQVVKGSKQFGIKVLFENATFSINESEHIAVIGPNGAGKSTLFKIITNQESLDSGEIVKSNGLRLGYLEQESDWKLLELTPESYFNEVQSHQRWPLWDLKKWGLRLGLSEELFNTPLKQLSGGYRMRFKLLDLMSQDPHLMLLDEPTNFLDLETLLVLETFLIQFKGAFLVISHDREFLNRVAEHTIEVEGGEIQKFPGPIDDYLDAKIQLRENIEKQHLNSIQKRKHLEDFVERFRAKASKAKQAQSKLKQLQKMEEIHIKALPIKAQISIPSPPHTGKEIVSLLEANVGYKDNSPLLSNINFQLKRGDHIGVVGVNGAGKSTLLKTLSGALSLLKGQLSLGYQVNLSYYAQHSADQLEPQETILQALVRQAHPSITQQDVLNLAGSLLFSNETINKKISMLSGGEKSRVALGQVLLRKSSLLLLDEPTNHLDFETVEALTQALSRFEGSLVVVSHDRSFIRRVATQILEIRDGRIQFYPGSYDEYVWSLEKGVLSEINSTESSTSYIGKNTQTPKDPFPSLIKENNTSETNFSYKDRKKNESEKRKLEKEILRLEELMKTLTIKQNELNDLLTQSPAEEINKLSTELTQVSESLIKTEESYLVNLESLHKLQN